jgi:uncharacterized membrane protein YfhO
MASRFTILGGPAVHRLLTWEGAAMRFVVIVLLLCIWLYLAYSEYQAGNMMLAGLFLLVGIALTTWRLRRTS